MKTPKNSVWPACLLFVLSCGQDDGAPPIVDDDMDTAVATTTTTPLTSGSGPEPICLPGELECDGNTSLRTCDETGLGWTAAECMPNQTCLPCNPNDGTGCTVARCVGPCESEDVLPSSAGCSFISNRTLHLVDRLGLTFDVPMSDWEVDGLVVANPNTELVANVQVFQVPEGQANEVPLDSDDATFTLQPLEWKQLDLDSSFVTGAFTMFRAGGMLRVEADAPVIAYQHAPWRAFVGNDSSMLLPETALGRNYVVAAYPPHYAQHQGAGEPTYFEIIAVEDGTKLKWHAQFAATSGNGLPIDEVKTGKWSREVSMNRFETLRITASSNYFEGNPHRRDVSGTVIESNKPLWVVGASRCSAVPPSDDFLVGCDPLQEVMIPLEYWGTQYVAPHPPDRPNDAHHWRIYGAEEGIEVTTQPNSALPGGYTFESRGDFIDVIVDHGESFVINATGPVLPVGYLETRDQDIMFALGDPAMYQLVSTDQFLNRYVFVTGIEWDAHYVQVVREKGGMDVTIDGNMTVTFDEEIGDFDFAVVQIGEGAHRIESDGEFGITQFGWANGPHEACDPPYAAMGNCNSSYAYPGGMKSEQIYVP